MKQEYEKNRGDLGSVWGSFNTFSELESVFLKSKISRYLEIPDN